jgi:hypothetical protein
MALHPDFPESPYAILAPLRPDAPNLECELTRRPVGALDAANQVLQRGHECFDAQE